MTKAELKAIWESVKENQRKLDSCEYHFFGPLIAKLGARYTCSACGGEITAELRHWYEKGLEHGYNAKDPK